MSIHKRASCPGLHWLAYTFFEPRGQPWMAGTSLDKPGHDAVKTTT